MEALSASPQPTIPAPLPGLPGQRRIVGVQFRHASVMIHEFDSAGLTLVHNSCVIVETERGEALGWTVGEPEDREPISESELRRVLRIASPTDEVRRKELQAREREALKYCAQRARALELTMKMIAVEWAHSGEKATFYFSAEDRIDFRTLVRDLAQHYRLRVEMRQVGPRDEAKIIGAMGPCGRETCCSSWMRAFAPVSIKMAKDQGLSINLGKVTGVCGRLLCCLAYEQDTYRDLRRKLPRLGKQVVTPRGPGRVVDLLVLRERVRVQLDGGTEWVDFEAAEVRPAGSAPIEEPEVEDAADNTDEIPVAARVEPPPPPPPPKPRVEQPRPPERPRMGGGPPQRRDEQRRPREENRGGGRPPRPHNNPAPIPKSAAPSSGPSTPPADPNRQNRQRHRRRGGGGGGSGGGQGGAPPGGSGPPPQ